MFSKLKNIVNVLAITALASQSLANASINIFQQCQMVNNILRRTDIIESCCFFDRVVCDVTMENIIQL